MPMMVGMEMRMMVVMNSDAHTQRVLYAITSLPVKLARLSLAHDMSDLISR